MTLFFCLILIPFTLLSAVFVILTFSFSFFFEHAEEQSAHHCAIQRAVERPGGNGASTRGAADKVVVGVASYGSCDYASNGQFVLKDKFH